MREDPFYENLVNDLIDYAEELNTQYRKIERFNNITKAMRQYESGEITRVQYEHLVSIA
jgi:2-hydroxy-3-keto-5-methylthiopentenyl-1-phosphate phosphatase